MEDNPDVIQVIARYLEDDEHTVVTAENGCEALEKFQAETFDLVITDRSMPKMSGDQLAIAIKGISPAMPIVLLTGFSEQNQPVVANVDLLLSKPISLNSIRRAINKVLLPEQGRAFEIPLAGLILPA